jgi:4-coumarate--CoA ligase
LDSEGFFKTGDVGLFNDDQSLMVVDRIKDIFKYKGYHINPSEVEDCIMTHEGVELVTVVGIPDDETQNLTKAAVVKKAGFEKLTEKEIIAHVAKSLHFSKHLYGGVVFMDSLPMTVSGKILKRAIRDKLLQ